MTNLTITVDEQTLKKARMRAVEEGTSVIAVLRAYLESDAGVGRERLDGLRKIRELANVVGMRRRVMDELMGVVL